MSACLHSWVGRCEEIVLRVKEFSSLLKMHQLALIERVQPIADDTESASNEPFLPKPFRNLTLTFFDQLHAVTGRLYVVRHNRSQSTELQDASSIVLVCPAGSHT